MSHTISSQSIIFRYSYIAGTYFQLGVVWTLKSVLPGMVPSSNAGLALGSKPPARREPSFSLK